jgi:hypothetical protein
MNVDTGQFAAISDRVERLEAGLAALSAELKVSIPLVTTAYAAGHGDGYGAGVESVLGRPASPPRSRPRHLQAVDGGSP